MDYDSGSLQDLIIQNIKDVKQFMVEEKAEGDKYTSLCIENSGIFSFFKDYQTLASFSTEASRGEVDRPQFMPQPPFPIIPPI
jgi:hypothetical protein